MKCQFVCIILFLAVNGFAQVENDISNHQLNSNELLSYYPLNVGNKWYYSEVGTTYDVEPHPIDKVYKVEIMKDTLLNDQSYFYVEGHPYDKKYWVRIDSVEGRIYKSYYPGQEERLLYDLMYEGDDSVMTEDGIILSIENSDTILWSDNREMKTYHLMSLYTQNMSFVEKIGIVHKFNSFDFGYTNVSLKGCVINGTVNGDTIVVNVNNDNKSLPNNYSLSQNYPNPFNPVTTIEYIIPSNVKGETLSLSSAEVSNVKLIVYDILGREVATLVDQKQNPGKYSVQFDAANLSSGIYYYRLKTDSFVQTKKMILLN